MLRNGRPRRRKRHPGILVEVVDLDAVQDHPSPQGDWDKWCEDQDNQWARQMTDLNNTKE